MAEELRFVETRLLRMQREIFHDLAWQHVAYQQGGLAAMEGLYQRGEILNEHISPWRDIDSGERALIERGTRDIVCATSSTHHRPPAPGSTAPRDGGPPGGGPGREDRWRVVAPLSSSARSPYYRGDRVA